MMSLCANKGIVIIEFAIITMVLVVLALGVVDTSEAFRIKHVLQSAAREGARVASVTPKSAGDPPLQTNDSRVLAVVDRILQDGRVDLSLRGRSLTAPAGFVVGNPVVVTVNYNYIPLFFGIVLRGTIPMKSSLTMRYEVNT